MGRTYDFDSKNPFHFFHFPAFIVPQPIELSFQNCGNSIPNQFLRIEIRHLLPEFSICLQPVKADLAIKSILWKSNESVQILSKLRLPFEERQERWWNWKGWNPEYKILLHVLWKRSISDSTRNWHGWKNAKILHTGNEKKWNQSGFRLAGNEIDSKTWKVEKEFHPNEPLRIVIHWLLNDTGKRLPPFDFSL